MSLEQKIESLTIAVSHLATLMSGQSGALAAQTVTGQVTPQQFIAPPVQQAPPQQFQTPPHPTGMPGAPFPQQPAPQQFPAQQLPFSDANGLLAWAKAKYDANNGIAGGLEGILKAHGLGNITDARPDQFVSLFTAINAL